MQESDNFAENHAWMVTFGDLLTLLLCLFVSAVALNGGKVRQTSNQSPEIAGLSENIPQAVPTTGTGIAFAQYESSPNVLMVGVLKQGFDASFEKLAEATRQRLINAVNLDSYAVDLVQIESCTPDIGIRSEARWSSASERAIAVRGQLIDASIRADRIQLRTVGPDCSALSAWVKGQDSEQLSMVVRIMRRPMDS